MSSPMFEAPEHMLLPVTDDCRGPAEPCETARWVCWCKAGESCTVVTPVELPLFEPDPHAACPDAGCSPDCPARIDARADARCVTCGHDAADHPFDSYGDARRHCWHCACDRYTESLKPL